MAIPLVINGVTFQYPQQFDKNWGPTLTNWSSAVTSGMLQKAGGAFTLTSEVDFGSSFGIKVKSIKSEEASIAATGFLRLCNASAGIVWRNALGNADLPLTVNASNQLTFNGVSIAAAASLTNSHIFVGNASNQPADVAMSGDITIANTGATTLGAGKVLNANVNASAAIAWSKLATGTPYAWLTLDSGGVITATSVTASKAIVSDSNGLPVASTTTTTELGYVHGVTSALQTQIDTKLAKAGDTMSGVLNMGSNKIISVANGAAAGEVVNYGQLKILQWQMGSTTTDFTTASGTFQTTNSSVSITPSAVTSRIFIMASGTVVTPGQNTGAQMSLFRGSTNLGDPTGMTQLTYTGSSLNLSAPVSMCFIDSPASTATLTYSVKILSSDSTSTVHYGNGRTQVIIVAEIV